MSFDGLIKKFTMLKRCCATVALILICCGLSSSALAHSPYFGQSESIEHPDFGNVTFAVLYGDGILSADPSQVVVFGSDGYLLAATPQSKALVIRCDSSEDTPNCRVYDEGRGLVLEPDYKHWARGRLIAQEGRPPRDAYPEFMDIEYGFGERPATFIEMMFFEAAGNFLLSVLWWGMAWSFIARPLWRLRRNGWLILPIRGWAVVSGILSIMAFLGMGFIAAFAWLLGPYSFQWFLLSFIMAALISAALTRPKAVVAAS